MADVHISESGTVVFDADASHDDLTQHTDGAFAVSVPGADGTASTATVNGISSSTGAPDIVTDLRLTKADLADAFAPAVNGREDTGAPAATHNPMAQPRDALNGDSHPPTHDMNSKASTSARDDEERDAQAEAMVIDSLRMQVQDLYTQVSQLNSKLVRSYDRVSDLEDDLHVASTSSRSSALKIAQLELERSQHLSALNTGLLVERSAVAAELTNIMERATAEAARAGKAENARHEIERELDDLSAGLFGQANSMVAQARFAAAGSERKVEEAELALRAAEDAVAAMQRQMQQLQAEKEAAETEAERVRVSMGKGKWIESDATAPSTKAIRLLSSHNPYQEFLLFVAHLRSIRPVSAHPPAMATLLPLPFPARLQAEDS
jgi:predicted  nucleic acid-binding Zn-ribbon protein